MDQAQVKPFVDAFMKKFIAILEGQYCSVVKEGVLLSVANLAGAAEQLFNPYLNATALTIFSLLKNDSCKEHAQMRGQCIEALTMIGQAINYDRFKPFVNDLINIMLRMQNQSLDKITNTQ